MRKEAEIIDLRDDSSTDSAPPVANNMDAPMDNDNSGREIKVENAAVENAASNDEGEDSDSSTKDYYKNLCTKLTRKMIKTKESDEESRRENRSLKEEIVELKNEVERLQQLVNM